MAVAERATLSSILRRFPPVEFAMAYGSGVVPQAGRGPDPTTTMVDFIFGRGARSPCPAMRLLIAFASGVRDSPSWHADNMDQHPRHYSCLARLLGPGTRLVRSRRVRIAPLTPSARPPAGGVSRMQRTAAGVHFNTLVPYDERTVGACGRDQTRGC